MILLKFNDSDVKNAFESVVNGLPESKYDATFKENTIALIENQYQSYYTPFMYVQGESDSKQSAITAFKLTLTPFFMRYINIGIQETYFNGLTYGNEAKETQEQIINEGTKTSDNPVNSIYQNLTNRVDRNGNNKNTLTRPDGRTPFGALEEDRGVLSPLFEMVNAFSMLLVSPDDECYCDELCDTFGFEIEKLYAQMNNLQTEVSAISDDVNKNTGAITELSEKVTQNTGDISTLKNNVSQNTSDISNLSTRVTSAEDNITAHTSQINQIDETLNNKLDKITSVSNSNQVYGKSAAGENLMYNLESHPNAGYLLQYDNDGNIYVNKGSSEYTPANMQNIADVEAKIPDVSNFATKSELSKKLDISGGTINGNLSVIGDINTVSYKSRGVEVMSLNIPNIRVDVGHATYGINMVSSNRPTVTIGNFTNKIAFKTDIPEYTSVDSVIYDTTNGAIVAYDGANEIHIPLLAGENVTIDASEDNKKIVISAAGGGGTGDVTAAGNNIFTGENEFRNYTYATSNFCFVDTKEDYLTNGYTTTIKNGGFDISYYENGEGKYWTTYADNQIINKDIDMEGEVVIKFPKKEGTFALTSDIPDTSSFVTLAGNNTFTGVNTFNNSIYAKNGVVAENTTNYGANSIRKGPNTYSFPNKSGTFAMTTDVIKNPIYFISFYANDPSGTCHLIGTMMSKNSYGTGQKTNEEFVVMLADNLYTNSNEGLAAYGRLVGKDILCIYSEDGLSIRCLNEENSEVDLPMVMFFVMETEL